MWLFSMVPCFPVAPMGLNSEWVLFVGRGSIAFHRLPIYPVTPTGFPRLWHSPGGTKDE